MKPGQQLGGFPRILDIIQVLDMNMRGVGLLILRQQSADHGVNIRPVLIKNGDLDVVGQRIQDAESLGESSKRVASAQGNRL